MLWGFFILSVVSIVSSFIRKDLIIFGCCVLFFLAGVMRFEVAEFIMRTDPVKKFNDVPGKITLRGQIIDEPDLRASSQKLKVKIDATQSVILVTTNSFPVYQYLDEIKLTGQLKTPNQFGDFNYKHYLQKDGVYSVMDNPLIEKVIKQHPYTVETFVYEKLLWIKGVLLTSLTSQFSPPQNFIMEGMIFGNDKEMPKEVKDKFVVTGLSHVTAVSGSNVVILINIAVVFFLALGLWRRQACYFAILCIWIYIVLIGFPASGVRAAVMCSAVLMAQILGRQNTSTRILVFAAALMLVQNPLLLPYDVGFQLSFLAALGIIYVKPILENIRLFSKNNLLARSSKSVYMRIPWFFLDILFITLAAQITTLPIIVYNFGTVSLVAPITNVLALPVVEIVTVLGFLTSVVGVFSHIVGFIVSLPCWFLLAYFLKVLDMFSQLWATITITYIPWFFVVVYYVVLFIVLRVLYLVRKPDFLEY